MSRFDEESETVRSVKKALGEPIGCELSPAAWKIRTNLMLVSFVSLVVAGANLHVNKDASFLGLGLQGLDDNLVTFGLGVANTYLLLHFVWSAWDNFVEWRLRITGTRLAHVTTGVVASDHGDYPNDPRQSTLYRWWTAEARKIGNLAGIAVHIHHRVQEWEDRLRCEIDARGGPNAGNIATVYDNMQGIREAAAELGRRVEVAVKALDAPRIPASLQRFDCWFRHFLRSQNLRWLLFDALVPILLGWLALIFLCLRYSQHQP